MISTNRSGLETPASMEPDVRKQHHVRLLIVASACLKHETRHCSQSVCHSRISPCRCSANHILKQETLAWIRPRPMNPYDLHQSVCANVIFEQETLASIEPNGIEQYYVETSFPQMILFTGDAAMTNPKYHNLQHTRLISRLNLNL